MLKLQRDEQKLVIYDPPQPNSDLQEFKENKSRKSLWIKLQCYGVSTTLHGGGEELPSGHHKPREREF